MDRFSMEFFNKQFRVNVFTRYHFNQSMNILHAIEFICFHLQSPDALKTTTSSSHHDSEYDTASDTPSSDLEDEDDFEDDDIDDNGEEGSVVLDLDRQRVEGEEDGEKKKVDDDEDRSNPQYIPKRGVFYEHDDRTAEEPLVISSSYCWNRENISIFVCLLQFAEKPNVKLMKKAQKKKAILLLRL